VGFPPRFVDGRTFGERCYGDGTECTSKHRQEKRKAAGEFDGEDNAGERSANDGSKEGGNPDDGKSFKITEVTSQNVETRIDKAY